MRSRQIFALMVLILVAVPAQAQFVFGRLVPPPPALEGNAASSVPDVSDDGRVFVFESGATIWVPGCISGCAIVGVDLGTNQVSIVSTTAGGSALNGSSFSPSTAGSGRFVSFETLANNLGLPVPPSGFQVVRKDRQTGALVLASASASGVPASGSASGQARNSSVSADGRLVSFRSDAANLVAGDSPGTEDVFVKDLQTGAIEVVSLTTSGAFAPAGTVTSTAHSMSADGRFVVFQSTAANLVPGGGGGPILVYVRDRSLGSTSLASVSSTGAAANGQSDFAAISPNGRFVSLRSFASNLGGAGGRVFVRDRQSASTTAVPFPVVNGNTATGCRESDVSNVGSVVLTCSIGNPLVDQVFLHVPGAAGTPFLISSDSSNNPGNQTSGLGVAVNANGLSMVFPSLANNLVPSDTNGVADNFVLIDVSVLNGLFADGFE